MKFKFLKSAKLALLLSVAISQISYAENKIEPTSQTYLKAQVLLELSPIKKAIQ